MDDEGKVSKPHSFSSNGESSCQKVLNIKSAISYDKDFPFYACPLGIGFFSIDGNRQFHNDKRQQKFLCIPKSVSKLNMDLNISYLRRVEKQHQKTEKLENLLKWIVLNKKTIYENFKGKPNTSKGFPVDFICYRGLLTEILITPFESKEDWSICATKFKGSIYLYSFDTENRKRRIVNMTEKEILMSSWGYKFEQYVTSDSINGKPDPPDTPVNEKEEFCCVVKSKLNDHSLLFGAEIDAVNPDKHCSQTENMQQYVELKTSRIIGTDRQNLNFCRYKLIKWWAQSFLVGIQDIHCGFRDDHGVVQFIHTFSVPEMHRLAKDLWSPSACMNFCDYFLTYVKKCVTTDNPNVVYKFDWKPGSDIICTKLISSEYHILPEWYTT